MALRYTSGSRCTSSCTTQRASDHAAASAGKASRSTPDCSRSRRRAAWPRRGKATRQATPYSHGPSRVWRCMAPALRQDQEGRLEGVLGVPRVGQQAATQAQHHRAVPGHQRGEGRLVAPPREALQQLGVRLGQVALQPAGSVQPPDDLAERLACQSPPSFRPRPSTKILGRGSVPGSLSCTKKTTPAGKAFPAGVIFGRHKAGLPASLDVSLALQRKQHRLAAFLGRKLRRPRPALRPRRRSSGRRLPGCKSLAAPALPAG